MRSTCSFDGAADAGDRLLHLVRRVLDHLAAGRHRLGHRDPGGLGHRDRGAGVHLEQHPLDGDHRRAVLLEQRPQVGLELGEALRRGQRRRRCAARRRPPAARPPGPAGPARSRSATGRGRSRGRTRVRCVAAGRPRRRGSQGGRRPAPTPLRDARSPSRRPPLPSPRCPRPSPSSCSTAWSSTSAPNRALDGLDLRVPGGQDHRAARPERRRQDHRHPDDHRRLRARRRPRAGVRPRPRGRRRRRAARAAASCRPSRRSTTACRGSTTSATRPSSTASGRGAAVDARIQRGGRPLRHRRGARRPGRRLLHRHEDPPGARRAACCTEPELLLYDEPTSGLDPESSHAVLELIHEMTDDGSTVVMCTHLLLEAEGLADQVVVLQDGVDVINGSPDELTRRYWPDAMVRLGADDVTAARRARPARGRGRLRPHRPRRGRAHGLRRPDPRPRARARRRRARG